MDFCEISGLVFLDLGVTGEGSAEVRRSEIGEHESESSENGENGEK